MTVLRCTRLFGIANCAKRRNVYMKTSNGLTHTPVLLREVLSYFRDSDLRVFLDCTMGGGGHTSEIIREHPELECVVGMDMDSIALKQASTALDPLTGQRPGLQLHLLEGNFRDLAALMMAHDPPLGQLLNEGIDGILMDLGMSSMQLDDPDRGFSFMRSGPLDMRMGSNIQTNAEEIVNTWSEFELGALFKDYGEELRWRQIARRICEVREDEIIKTTQQLVDIIGKGSKRHQHKKSIHPATRVFQVASIGPFTLTLQQALRIAVNDELRSLDKTLPLLIESLRDGGVCGVISFHSLEDRLVKNAFKSASKGTVPTQYDNKKHSYFDYDYESEVPSCSKGRVLTKRPVTATKEEIDANPRSRSAKLRVFRKSVEVADSF